MCHRRGQVAVDQDADRDTGLRWRPGVIVSAEGARTFVSNDDRLCREARGLVDPGLGLVCDTESSTDAFGASIGMTVARFLALQGTNDSRWSTSACGSPSGKRPQLHHVHQD